MNNIFPVHITIVSAFEIQTFIHLIMGTATSHHTYSWHNTQRTMRLDPLLFDFRSLQNRFCFYFVMMILMMTMSVRASATPKLLLNVSRHHVHSQHHVPPPATTDQPLKRINRVCRSSLSVEWNGKCAIFTVKWASILFVIINQSIQRIYPFTLVKHNNEKWRR